MRPSQSQRFLLIIFSKHIQTNQCREQILKHYKKEFAKENEIDKVHLIGLTLVYDTEV